MGFQAKVRNAFNTSKAKTLLGPDGAKSVSRHRVKSRRRLQIAVGCSLLVVVYYVAVLQDQIGMQAASPHVEGAMAGTSRQILSEFSLTDTFISSLYSDCQNPIDYALVGPVYFLGCIYFFLGLAVICDDYFVASLENISETLRLTEDVAGATFMAAGSSAPELFTSLMGTLVFVSDVGIGTIVGSAVFNILIIVGLTILLAGQKLVLDWRPLTRDCSYYGFSIILLIACFSDGAIAWWESVVFVGAYIGYIIVMVFNPSIMGAMIDVQCAVYTMFLGRKVQDDSDMEEDEEEGNSKATLDLFGEGKDDDKNKDESINQFKMDFLKKKPDEVGDMPAAFPVAPAAVPGYDDDSAVEPERRFDSSNEGVRNEFGGMPVHANPASFPVNHAQLIRDAALMAPKSEDPRVRLKAAVYAVIAANRFMRFVTDNREVVEEEISPEIMEIFADQPEDVIPEEKPKKKNIFMTIAGVILFILVLPYKVLFIITVPDCGRGGCWYWWFPFTFGHSVGWIAILSFFMVDFASRAGCVLLIPDIIMGLTFVAAGTSVPDALSSISVAKDGQGDMAVANAIGSNVFDICFGLGLPWFIKTIFVYPLTSVEINGSVIETVMFTCILFGTLFLFYGLIALSRFALSPKLGYIFITGYFVFVIWSLIWAYGVEPNI